MKVFLTGAGGFIGKHIQAALENSGHLVTCHSLSVNGPFVELPRDIDVVVNSAGKLGGDGFSTEEITEANLNTVSGKQQREL